MTIALLVAWLVLGWVDQGWFEADTSEPTATATAVENDGSVWVMDGTDEIPPRP